MKKWNTKKGFSIGIILVFIGVAIAPSINVTAIKLDNDLVEINTEIYKNDGISQHILKLSKEDSIELNNVISDFKKDLSDTTTVADAVEIYNDVILSFFELGLFPEDLNIEDAQKLVLGPYYYPEIIQLMDSINTKDMGISNVDRNFLCLISGESGGTFIFGPNIVARMNLYLGIIISAFFLWKFLLTNFNIDLSKFYKIDEDRLYNILIETSMVEPIGMIGYGVIYDGQFGIDYRPAEGWVWSAGLNGIKQRTGEFYGKIILRALNSYYCYGSIGFTGLRVTSENYNRFYVGTSIFLSTSSELPRYI